MKDYNEYNIIGETSDKNRKAKYWQAAIGLQKVDGLVPSEYLVGLAQENVDGKLSYTEVEQLLYTRYENETEEDKENRLKESDLVSTRIAAILDGGGFPLNPESLKTIHGILFQDLYSHAGKFREYNISKEEPILNGRSVVYSDYRNIRSTLEYDFAAERDKTYKGFDHEQIVKRITEFTSALWQIHPFMEGNTRTTAVFIECYLNNMGFSIDNEMFKNHSLYFRNALVVDNYASIMEGITPNNEPLIKFYKNLLLNGKYKLSNKTLYVLECFSEKEQTIIKSLQKSSQGKEYKPDINIDLEP